MANTVIFPNNGSFTDAAGNVWSVDAQDQVVMDGNPDPNTGNVIEMADVNGVAWQENSQQLWWSWNPNAADNYMGWSPSAGTSVSPLNMNTVIFPIDGSFTDAAGNVWSVDGQDQVVMNGTPDPNTGNVIEMADVNGVAWQENSNHLWWSWNPNAADNYKGWSPSAGTPISPLGANTQTLTWVGGSNLASAQNPNNWSPAGLPQPGDPLVMSSGNMEIGGYNLAGDTLYLVPPSLIQPYEVTLSLGGGGSVNVSAENQTFALQLQGNQAGVELTGGDNVGLSGTVNLAVNTDLVVTGSPSFAYGFHASGVGSHLTNDGVIGLTNATLDVDLDGSGTYNLGRYHDGPGNTEVTGPVASGLTFNLQGDGGGFYAGLTIDRPQEFQGAVTVGNAPDGGPSSDLLTLAGLSTADTYSYDTTNDLLSIYHGNVPIDTLNLKTNGESFTVAQQNGNVGIYIDMATPSGASILPVHV